MIKNPDPRCEALLNYWFETLSMEDWFKQQDHVDEEIRERFSHLLPFAAEGTLHGWLDSLDGARALLLLLDQVPRNSFRNDGQAFAYDEQAQALTQFTLERYSDEIAELGPSETLFILLPLEHAEDMALQEQCVGLFKAFASRYSGEDAKQWAETLDYAERHHVVIERFGRFPHRNKVLGRTSTPEEEAYLAENPGGF